MMQSGETKKEEDSVQINESIIKALLLEGRTCFV